MLKIVVVVDYKKPAETMRTFEGEELIAVNKTHGELIIRDLAKEKDHTTLAVFKDWSYWSYAIDEEEEKFPDKEIDLVVDEDKSHFDPEKEVLMLSTNVGRIRLSKFFIERIREMYKKMKF